MPAPLLSRFARILTASILASGAIASATSFSSVYAESGLTVLAQASETSTPADAPVAEHGHDTPAASPALPNLNPRINKKRVAFWGIAFMSATSVAFVIFGVWAMRRAPKPGQQRPG